MNKAAPVQLFLRVLWFLLAILRPVFHTHISFGAGTTGPSNGCAIKRVSSPHHRETMEVIAALLCVSVERFVLSSGVETAIFCYGQITVQEYVQGNFPVGESRKWV
jgi:hypothetical protein